MPVATNQAARSAVLLALLCLPRAAWSQTLEEPTLDPPSSLPAPPSSNEDPPPALPGESATIEDTPLSFPGQPEAIEPPDLGATAPAGDTNASPFQQIGSGQDNATPGEGFALRLARAPKMMGDFFGQSFASGDGSGFVGRAIHHIVGSTFGVNDLHRLDESQPVGPGVTGPVALYLGGPAGDISGSFFFPNIDPPLPDTVTDLMTIDVDGTFTAIGTSDNVDVLLWSDLNDNGLVDVGETSVDIPNARVFNVFQDMAFSLPAGGPGDLIGRSRIQDNNSAMPQDRLFFDYSYFHNAKIIPEGIDINRFAPGAEKTFLDGLVSLEARLPMGMTLNSDTTSGLPADTSNYELGNLTFALKGLLVATEDWALAAGMGISTPTGDDARVFMVTGSEFLRVANDSVHLLPYVALLCSPEDASYFAHAFLTLDLDTNGNRVLADLDGGGLAPLGKWNDQNLLTANFAFGRWIYESSRRSDRLQGVAWSAELHYTATLNNSDVIQSGSFTLGDPNADLSLLNATFGGHALIGKTTFTVGYSTPLTSSDRVFDGELRAFVNRAF